MDNSELKLYEYIRDFFEKKGLDVKIEIIEKPHLSLRVVKITPQISVSFAITDELLLTMKEYNTIDALLSHSLDKIRDLFFGLLEDRKIYASENVKKWIFIYNPKELDPSKFLPVLLMIDI